MHLKTDFPRLAVPTAALLVLGAAATTGAHALPVVGLTTTNAIITFDSASPTSASSLAFISGLQSANERLLSIDLRPTTGVVYGVSTDSKVYTVTTGGSATYVATLGQPLVGSVGIDFNPVNDLSGMTALRVVSSSGQNLAFNTTTLATTIATSVETGFSAVAYANNDKLPGTTTALYYIDTETDELKFAPGSFNAPVITPVGSLGFNVNGVAGFDIYGSSTGFAAMTDADTGKSGFYTIDLMTGAATFAGDFGIGGNTAIAPPLLGLTVGAVVPEPETYALMLAGLGAVGFMARRRQTRR